MTRYTFVSSTNQILTSISKWYYDDLTNDLVGKELAVVLTGQVWLRWFGRVELQAFANAFTQNVQRRIGLHDFAHGLLHQRLHARNPIAVRRVQLKTLVIDCIQMFRTL